MIVSLCHTKSHNHKMCQEISEHDEFACESMDFLPRRCCVGLVDKVNVVPIHEMLEDHVAKS